MSISNIPSIAWVFFLLGDAFPVSHFVQLHSNGILINVGFILFFYILYILLYLRQWSCFEYLNFGTCLWTFGQDFNSYYSDGILCFSLLPFVDTAIFFVYWEMLNKELDICLAFPISSQPVFADFVLLLFVLLLE